MICNILSSWRKCSIKPKEHKTQIFNTLIFIHTVPDFAKADFGGKKLLGIQFWTRLSSTEVAFWVEDNSLL